jgi:hypothetical protein
MLPGQLDLFALADGPMLTPKQRRELGGKRKSARPNGYPKPPGSGPKGETCKSCAHIRRVDTGCRKFRKCGLLEGNWTHGPGTDILAGAAACSLWRKPVAS